GARNIRIEEVAEADNYLAVMSDNNEYYLNGHVKLADSLCNTQFGHSRVIESIGIFTRMGESSKGHMWQDALNISVEEINAARTSKKEGLVIFFGRRVGIDG
ncbi:MAG: hypothetical protein AAF402_09285, partial [Pseudomonadota bacterium]